MGVVNEETLKLQWNKIMLSQPFFWSVIMFFIIFCEFNYFWFVFACLICVKLILLFLCFCKFLPCIKGFRMFCFAMQISECSGDSH